MLHPATNMEDATAPRKNAVQLALTPDDLIRVHSQAKQDYAAWAIENGYGDILSTLIKLNERCCDLSPIYDKTYGRDRGKKTRSASGKARSSTSPGEADAGGPASATSGSFDVAALEPLVEKILERLLPKLVQPMVTKEVARAVEQALDEQPYVNGHDDDNDGDDDFWPKSQS